MRKFILSVFVLATVFISFAPALTQDQKMAWWRSARFGMFVHWGAYAQLHGWWNGRKVQDPGEWIMYYAGIPKSSYETSAAAPFNPTQFNAHAWVSAAKAAGQKYLVITSKHHEGFSMFTTKVPNFSPYDVVEYTPWKQDPLAAISAECKTQGITFCVYYSIMDWHHPDQADSGATMLNKTEYVSQMKAQLAEIVSQYHPAVIWFDGNWQSWWTEADGQDLHAYLMGLDSSLIVNNRIAVTALSDGDYFTPEQTIPSGATMFDVGRDWESCDIMNNNNTWGYVDYDTTWKSVDTLLTRLVSCASEGGNYLLNVGPSQLGVIPQAEVDTLAKVGAWMGVYGQAIYGTQQSIFTQVFSWGKVTAKAGMLYLCVTAWPSGSHQISLPKLKNTINKVYLLNDSTQICAYTTQGSTMTITLSASAPNPYISVVAISLNGAPRASDSLYINDTYSPITYSGAWSYASGRGLGDFDDDVHYTQTNGDYFQYSFNGLGVDFITEKYSDEGQVGVYIDGNLAATVNCSNTTRLGQQVVFHQDLSPGNHTIKGVKVSGTYMLLDAFRIKIDTNATVSVRNPRGSRAVPPAASIAIAKTVYSRAVDKAVVFFARNGLNDTRRFSVRIFSLDGSKVAEIGAEGNVPAVSWDMKRKGSAGMYGYSARLETQHSTITKSGTFLISQ